MDKTKKVAIQTCFIDNYGACLQAYALQQSIKKLDCEAKILNFTRYNSNKKKFFEVIKYFVYFSFKFVFPISQISEKIKLKKVFKNFRRNYLEFDTTYKGRDFKSFKKFNDHYNYFVCGSDIIWNPNLRYDNIKFDMLYFVSDENKKIAYAPSFGIYEFPQNRIDECKKYLERFDYLSTREDTGVKILKDTFGLESMHVLDPSLLLSKNEWERLIVDSSLKIENEYCLFYVFDEFDLNPIIDKILKESTYDVYLLTFSNKNNIKKNPRVKRINKNCGPIEFVYLIANSKCVFANSFHAVAFAINMNVPFIVFKRDSFNASKSINSRMESVTRFFKLTDRMQKFDEIINKNINDLIDLDYSEANDILKDEREKSLSYLKKSLM